MEIGEKSFITTKKLGKSTDKHLDLPRKCVYTKNPENMADPRESVWGSKRILNSLLFHSKDERASFLDFQCMIERLSIVGSETADGSSNLPRAIKTTFSTAIS